MALRFWRMPKSSAASLSATMRAQCGRLVSMKKKLNIFISLAGHRLPDLGAQRGLLMVAVFGDRS